MGHMKLIKQLISRTQFILDCILSGSWVLIDPHIVTFQISSTASFWRFQQVQLENINNPIRWTVSGPGIPTSVYWQGGSNSQPDYDLSGSTGLINVQIANFIFVKYFQSWTGEGIVGMVCEGVNTNTKIVAVQGSTLTTIDLSTFTNLENIWCSNNPNATSLLTGVNPNLLDIQFNGCNIHSVDISNCPLINKMQAYENNMTPAETDQCYIDCASVGVSRTGQLKVRNNRTAASDAARATLVGWGWILTETYTT